MNTSSSKLDMAFAPQTRIFAVGFFVLGSSRSIWHPAKHMKSTSPNHTRVAQASVHEAASEDRWARVATAAYYRSECRGFEAGHELEDWLAAEDGQF